MSLKDFQILSKIGFIIIKGEGAYSSVYKVRRLIDNQEYALKKVKLMELSDKEK
jgi:NIMA (never in mitosis gene a)-related kinase